MTLNKLLKSWNSSRNVNVKDLFCVWSESKGE